MAPVLTVADIEERWRPLTPEETVVAQTLVGDIIAWAHVVAPGLQARIDNDTSGNFTRNVTRILASAVIRVMKNPEAFKTEQDGSYAYTLDKAISTGELTLTGAALRGLVGRAAGSTISLRDPALGLIAPDRSRATDGFTEIG